LWTAWQPYYLSDRWTRQTQTLRRGRIGADVTIEKVFAIRAEPREIFAALERDLEAAADYAGTTHEVLQRDPHRSLDLRVTIGMVPCRLTYRIIQTPEHSEVAATLTPYGWRYAMFQIATLGMRRSFFEMALVEALSNLKSAVEDAEFPDESESPGGSAE
jgi:hypothetical protein